MTESCAEKSDKADIGRRNIIAENGKKFKKTNSYYLLKKEA